MVAARSCGNEWPAQSAAAVGVVAIPPHCAGERNSPRLHSRRSQETRWRLDNRRRYIGPSFASVRTTVGGSSGSVGGEESLGCLSTILYLTRQLRHLS